MVQQKKKDNPGSVEARIDQLVEGLAKLSDSISLNVIGTNYVPSSLSAALTAKKALYVTADQAHIASKQAVAARDSAQPDTLAFLDAVEGVLVGSFGATSPQLTTCGVEPKKPRRKMTPEQRLLRAEKARATRADKKAAKAATPAPAPNTGGTQAK